MTHLNSIFNKFTETWGGELDTSKKDEISSILEKVRTDVLKIINDLRANNPQYPDVYIGFINNEEADGITFKNQNSYFIGISKGFYTDLNNRFKHLLANSVHLKNVTRKNETDGHIPRFIFYAFRFFILNQYAHIINGHIDYLANNGQEAIIYEKAEKLENENNTLQSFEMDGDCFSAHISIRYLLKDMLNFDKSLGIKMLDESLIVWLYSTYTVLRVMVSEEYDIDNLGIYSHPHPGIRHHFIVSEVHELLDKLKISSGIKILTSNIVITVSDCERVFSDIMGTPKIRLGIICVNEGTDQMDKIVQTWNSLRPSLIEYSKGHIPIFGTSSEENIN